MAPPSLTSDQLKAFQLFQNLEADDLELLLERHLCGVIAEGRDNICVGLCALMRYKVCELEPKDHIRGASLSQKDKSQLAMPFEESLQMARLILSEVD